MAPDYDRLTPFEHQVVQYVRDGHRMVDVHAERPEDVVSARCEDIPAVLEAFAAAESAAEAGPYRPYADILREGVIRIGSVLGFAPTAEEAEK